MMDKGEILGIVRTITDGIRDAGMQYDYYQCAKKGENTALAELHLSEMQKRLNGVQEWYKRAMSMLADEYQPDAITDALMEDYKMQYREMVKKMENAKI